MFWLAEITDRTSIEPKNFAKPTHEALIDEINNKYCNRVVPNVGLCIHLFDILNASEGLIYHSDGCSYTTVSFRMMVFRPFIGEVLVGKIKRCAEDGVREFFDDILIPADLLQEGSVFDTEEQLWVWKWEQHEMYMDLEEVIRFRVVEEHFSAVTPAKHERQRLSSISGESASNVVATNPKTPPYALTASIQENGLGLVSWWQ